MTVQPIPLFVTNTKDTEEEITTIENVGDEDPHSNTQDERVGHLRPMTDRFKLVGKGHIAVDKLVNNVDQNAVHAHSLDRIARPHLPHIHQQVHQGKHNEARSSGDADEGRVPLILVDRHVPVILLESTEKSADEQQQKTRHRVRPNMVHRFLHLLDDRRHESSQIDEEDGVQESHESFALEVVAVVHIGHRRAVVDVLLSEHLHIDVPIDAARASLVASEVADASRTGVSSRTPRRRDEHGDKPVGEGTEEGKNRVEWSVDERIVLVVDAGVPAREEAQLEVVNGSVEENETVHKARNGEVGEHSEDTQRGEVLGAIDEPREDVEDDRPLQTFQRALESGFEGRVSGLQVLPEGAVDRETQRNALDEDE